MQKGIRHPADFFAIYSKAAWEKDATSMACLYHNNVSVFDMWDDKRFSAGLGEWYEAITAWLTSLKHERVKVSFENIEIEKDESIAFASALVQYQAVASDDKVLRSMRNRISLGFLKSDQFWKVKHQHTSAPIDANLRANLAI
jgi:ketosteroid isomerase-like protein